MLEHGERQTYKNKKYGKRTRSQLESARHRTFLMSIFTILSPIVSPVIFVTGFMGSYIVYIALTFRYKIIDIKIF